MRIVNPTNMKLQQSAIVVVKDKQANEVARAMIENGQKEPFYIFDFKAAHGNVQRFREKLPRVQIFYAMKSNDYSMMIKLAISLGLGFDCASPGEIHKIRKYNVNPMSIIYAAPVKEPEQMMFARKSGVRHTTFDSSCELKKLSQYWPDSRLLIRIKLESDSVYKLGDKFGCDYAEAAKLLNEAAVLGMIVVGVAFHVGSGCFSAKSYVKGLRISRALFDHEARAGRKMTLLDIGGGFINVESQQFDQIANLVNEGLEKWFSDPSIQIITEPGRLICETAFTLYTNIRDVRTIIKSNMHISMVYANNGTHDSCRFIEKWHNTSTLKRTEDFRVSICPTQDTIIWGPTLDDRDSLCPGKLVSCTIDDWLIFNQHGAYSAVVRSEFCGKKISLTVPVMSEFLWNSLKDKPIFSTSLFVKDAATALLPSTLPSVQLRSHKTTMSDSDYVVSFKSVMSPAYVLRHESGSAVARAMICGGRQTQPFYVFDMDEAARRVRYFQRAMPRVKIFYAVKANDTDMMLRLAVALGLGFDCASPGEIYKTRKLNINPESIIYAMPCKTDEEMVYARQIGVKHTTFDTSNELKKIKRSWPDAKLLIRIKIDGTAKKMLGLKFGCDFEEASALLDEAASLGLNVVGVAFHVGSICYSPSSYELGLRRARALFDHEAERGRRMNVVDIGGGFLSHRTDSIDEASFLINDTLNELFPDTTVQIIAEPGRYLCDSAFKMFCSVIGERQVIRDNKPINMLYLNNGVYGTMRFDENWHKIKKFQRTAEVEPMAEDQTILWGPTCDSIDRPMQDQPVELPRCSLGDWLELDIHGAYTFTFSTRFSCLEIPLIRPVLSEDLWNTIKQCSVFQSSDFVLNPDLSAPLPSTLPPVLPTADIYEHTDIPTLI